MSCNAELFLTGHFVHFFLSKETSALLKAPIAYQETFAALLAGRLVGLNMAL